MSKRILSAALALVLLCLSLGAGAETLTVTDMTGREVTLPQAARRKGGPDGRKGEKDPRKAQ